MNNNNNFMVVEPVAPTYLVSDVNVAKIVKFLFEPEQRAPIKYVIQDVSGLCLIEEDEDAMPFSTLPSQADTVADNAVYDVFEAQDYNPVDTLREFKAWGINKVYLAPFYDRTISMEDFLDGVQKHFVNKGKNYRSASSNEKEIIFK